MGCLLVMHTRSLRRRSSGQYTAAVEQYEQAASIGKRNHDPAYKELDILVISHLCPHGMHIASLRMLSGQVVYQDHQRSAFCYLHCMAGGCHGLNAAALVGLTPALTWEDISEQSNMNACIL